MKQLCFPTHNSRNQVLVPDAKAVARAEAAAETNTDMRIKMEIWYVEWMKTRTGATVKLH